MQPLLKKNGVIVVAERTVRSASSYPLPDIASSYWANIFAEPRPSRRFNSATSLGMALSVSCYGEQMTLPTELYIALLESGIGMEVWRYGADCKTVPGFRNVKSRVGVVLY